MPNVNGYQLREAIRKWELRRVTLANQFTDVLTAYPNEKKPKPEAVAEDLLVAENAVAQLQTAQQEYNLAVTVDVQGTKMTLAHAVKLIGGAGRISKLWGTAAGRGKKDRDFGYRSDGERDPTKVYKERQISVEDATKRAEAADRYAGAIRSAISTGNATSVNLNLKPELL
jgi:hypothetical protein